MHDENASRCEGIALFVAPKLLKHSSVRVRRSRLSVVDCAEVAAMTQHDIESPPVAWHLLLALASSLLAALMATAAAAQAPPGPSVEFTAGWAGFTDDGIVNETLVGGAARWHLLPRISVGPEIIYIGGDNHSHLIVTGNVTFNVTAPASGRRSQVTP